MADALFEQFIQYFHNRNYEAIPTDSHAVAMFGTFEANHLYLINLIALDDGYDLDAERYLEYKQLTQAQFAGNDADKTILLNIIISDRTDHIYEVFNYTPDLSESFIDVTWLVDKTEEKLIIPKKQLKNVLGIEKDIKRMLGRESVMFYELKERSIIPVVTYGLILMNLLVWLTVEWMGSTLDGDTLIRAGALKYDLVIEGRQFYRLFNAMFLHIGITHLFHNMFSLYIFGTRLERFLPPVQMLLVYLGSGVVGSLMSLGSAWLSGIYPIAAGASGAVYGLMGSLLFISFFQRKPIQGITTYILWLFFVLGIVYSVMTPNVDIFAHLGGFLGGVGLTALVLLPNKKFDGYRS